jgi:hypothetical protein
MVWLNFAEGDVKFSPGHKRNPELAKIWLEGNPGQVMEDGYTLATEKGRAGIEFENGAVVYLAESSVLEFNRLRVTTEETETQLSLLTGTVTISHLVGQDPIRIATSTTNFRFTGTETASLESTLDGAVLRAVRGVVAPLTNDTPPKSFLNPGESAAFVDGRLVLLKDVPQTAEDAVWEQWVEGRLAERHALLAEGMKEAGLHDPIPGLAGMVASGKFSDCAPYGKCWEPNEIVERAESASQATQAAQTAPQAPQSASANGPKRNKKTVVNNTLLVRCPMEAWTSVSSPNWIQYGTCFYGTWERRRRVIQHHHKHPCYFVKTKHGIGIIPKHPLDVKGKPPINAKSGIFVLVAQKGQLHAEVQPPPTKGIQLLENPPSRLERGLMQSAPRVTPPAIQAKLNENVLPHGILSVARTGEAKNVTDIRYDYKSKAFVGSTGPLGNTHLQVVAHVDSGFTGGDHVQMGAHGSGASGGGAGGSGSHGSSSGGGGGHSGASSSTSSASSSVSAASAGGGSHH